MANTTTGLRENLISARTQRLLQKTSVMPALANFEEQSRLYRGQSINRPKKSRFVVGNYTANTDVTAQDWTGTQELLTVDQSKVASFKIDPTEQKQQMFDIQAEWMDELMYALRNDMDAAFLAKISDASYTVDASTFGGTSGNPVDLSLVDADNVYGRTAAELYANAVEQEKGLVTVVDPIVMYNISRSAKDTGFSLADTVFVNGYTAKNVAGTAIYVSNNLPYTQTVTYDGSTAPSDGDTVTILGITFTFKTTLGSTAGNVLIGASSDTAATNLVAALNGSAGAGSTYVALSDDNRKKLQQANMTATVDTSANTFTFTTAGRAPISKSSGLAEYTIGDGVLSTVVMQKGAIDAVVQFSPEIQINKAVNNLGSTILGHTLYGLKTFTEGAQRMAKVSIKV